MSKRKNHYLCEAGIEKSVAPDHNLSSLGKPRDAPRDGFLYTTLTLVMDFYYNQFTTYPHMEMCDCLLLEQ